MGNINPSEEEQGARGAKKAQGSGHRAQRKRRKQGADRLPDLPAKFVCDFLPYISLDVI